MHTSTTRQRRAHRDLTSEDDRVSPARILLAEDDPALRCLLAAELRKDGYIVEEAKTGYDLLGLLANLTLRSETCDLLVTDIRMPGVSGLSIVEALRQGMTEGTSGTPVILITAFGDEETHTEARRLGTQIFDKPFDLDAFRAAVTATVSPTAA